MKKSIHSNEIIFTNSTFWCDLTVNYQKQSEFCRFLLPQGGEIGINIEWKCNLDLNIEYCVPKYSFTRLDAPFAKNAISKGYNFR